MRWNFPGLELLSLKHIRYCVTSRLHWRNLHSLIVQENCNIPRWRKEAQNDNNITIMSVRGIYNNTAVVLPTVTVLFTNIFGKVENCFLSFY